MTNSLAVADLTPILVPNASERYKLFTNDTFRDKVTDQLKKQFLEQGLISSSTTIKYALVCGHIHSGNEELIEKHFNGKGWKVFKPVQIREFVEQLASKGYEDDIVTMTVKILKPKH